jgi:hypothetical protein
LFAQFKILCSFFSRTDIPSEKAISVEHKGAEKYNLFAFTADCTERIEKGANSPSDVEEV